VKDGDGSVERVLSYLTRVALGKYTLY